MGIEDLTFQRSHPHFPPVTPSHDNGGNLGVRRSMRDARRSVIGVHRCSTLAGVHFEALGERGRRNEPLLSPKMMAGWASQEEVLRSWLDFEALTTLLPP